MFPGRYFSRGTPGDLDVYYSRRASVNAQKVFEVVAGIHDVKVGGAYSSQESLTGLTQVRSEFTLLVVTCSRGALILRLPSHYSI